MKRFCKLLSNNSFYFECLLSARDCALHGLFQLTFRTHCEANSQRKWPRGIVDGHSHLLRPLGFFLTGRSHRLCAAVGIAEWQYLLSHRKCLKLWGWQFLLPNRLGAHLAVSLTDPKAFVYWTPFFILIIAGFLASAPCLLTLPSQ